MAVNDLYQPVWNKFLRVITIKLKLAMKKQEPEFLVLDILDFEKVSHRKNSNYQFRVELKEGRVQKSKTTSPIGLDFARALKADEIISGIIKSGHVIFSLNSKLLLSISPVLADAYIPAAQPVAEEALPVPDKDFNE